VPLYFLTCVGIFWIPGTALLVANWRRLDKRRKKSFFILLGIMAVVTFAMEYVYLAADIWSFSEAHDPLLGLVILGAPIEEFTFWFGATPFVLGVYWTARRFFPAIPGKTPRQKAKRRAR
jgi:lycopene cyclase domain-containing protein